MIFFTINKIIIYICIYKHYRIKKRYPFGILHEELVSKQLKNTRTPLTNKTPCNNDNSVYNDHLKNNHAHNIIRTEFSSRYKYK